MTQASFFNASPHNNGFLVFVLGILFALTVYHLLLYIQQRDKVYLLYASYTLVLLTAYLTFTENSFVNTITAPIDRFLDLTHHFWVWLYNIIYYFFILHFLKFQHYFPKQTKWITNILWGTLSLGVILFINTIYTGNSFKLDDIYELIFTKIIILLTFWGFYLAFRVKEPTKVFIIFGCFFLFLGSLFAILVIDFDLITENANMAFLVFYVAIIFENICFSLGLGIKQKEILQTKNRTQAELIDKLHENEKLKENINQQLQAKVNALKQQVFLQKQVDNQKMVALKSQMNPHFIFNSLNSINLYIKQSDTLNASKYLNMFSKLIRKVLENSKEENISLKEELHMSRLYIDIENMRFSNQIYFELIDNQTNTAHIMIPPLILQPFLENAIWHGLSTKKGNKKIKVCIDNNNHTFLKITITDNGIGRKAAQRINEQKSIPKSSLGLKITLDRLIAFAPNSCINYIDLKNMEGTPTGTQVEILIPLIENY